MKKSKTLIILMLLSSLTACSLLPTIGPSQNKIINISNSKNLPEVNIVELDLHSVLPLFQARINQNFSEFTNSLKGYSGVIDVGDILDISIWEAPPAVLFGGTLTPSGQGNSQLVKLPEQMVSRTGKVTIPFVGALSVKGKSPERVQRELIHKLSSISNNPQVIVRIVKNNSANVTVLRQGNSIRMPLTSHGERILDAVAAVGGIPSDLQDVTVQITRGKQVKAISFSSLISDPRQNILLLPGDVIGLLNSPLSFTGLGAVGANKVVKFSTKGINLAEAIGKMGGLIDTRSDPRGIFVFRYIPFNELNNIEKEKWKMKGYNMGMEIPTVYRVNLLDPNSLFVLQRFPIQDKDIVYVANAPLAEFQKFLRMIFSITSPITSTANSVGNL
ncbi:polysaccharide export outer membrane protein [Bisgaardia hudsonensis]|uniref:Polysaccharide export outer membrane protein n=1 Tax=Bisgaardia hudsonensis TaxID=109472 RepID=A0A4R2N350_9PAST|nr:polysaccharide biosynthesis/export family protein [Bisgaardia hudsonensis]QLB12717.1 sugar ABC transporter substrate-binding protein [Bisgaardia hudsonensis]TCP14267.1 polysaccharide export outer membrane protein [Bisgaardia hudsonensis]